MKNENNADVVLKEINEAKGKDPLGQLINEVRQINQRARKIKIVHRALWHFGNETCIGIFPESQEQELFEILRMLKHHQERLEDFLNEATKYCDRLEP